MQRQFVSAQVINEFVNTARRKLQMDWGTIEYWIEFYKTTLHIVPLTFDTNRKAMLEALAVVDEGGGGGEAAAALRAQERALARVHRHVDGQLLGAREALVALRARERLYP